MPQNSVKMTSVHAGRDISVDIIRGIAIILVVLGHANRGQMETMAIAPASLHFLDFIVYAVHVPVFFLVSGYFSFVYLSKRKNKYFLGVEFQI